MINHKITHLRRPEFYQWDIRLSDIHPRNPVPGRDEEFSTADRTNPSSTSVWLTLRPLNLRTFIRLRPGVGSCVAAAIAPSDFWRQPGAQ